MENKFPKNVRQIGNVSDTPKIYVEDYVDTFLNQICDKADKEQAGAFLVGKKEVTEGQECLYIFGAICMEFSDDENEIISQENFEKAVWAAPWPGRPASGCPAERSCWRTAPPPKRRPWPRRKKETSSMMLYNERAELILQQLQLQSTVKVTELSQLLQVSVDTVRRDLKNMEQEGWIKYVRGGACLPEDQNLFSNFTGREIIHSELKREAARKARQRIM